MWKNNLKTLSALLHSKKISSRELTEIFLKRIEHLNPHLNAFVHTDFEKSLQAAMRADEKIQNGTAGVLTGIPIAQKDIFCAKGWVSSCASKMLANFVSPYDAFVVQKLENEAGMVSLGRTNMDEFAMGSSNETSYFGAVKNPWDLARVPGGSSGGSAAAISAFLTPAATGTDTGGSIRQPAALCGITGLKPTYGRISRFGMIAFASSLDQAGPMAHSSEDCALLLNAMAGFDERDSTSLNLEKEDFCAHLEDDLKDIKIGLPREFFENADDSPVTQKVLESVAIFKKLGAEIVEISLPHIDLSVAAYYVIAPAEASSNLSRYDGVRYGFRAENYNNLEEMYQQTRAQGFGDEVRRRIFIGTYVLSHGYYDAYYLKAQKIRRLIAQDFQNAFAQCDFVLSPTSPDVAFKLGEKAKDSVKMYLSDIYTIGVNLAGLPAMSMPCGFVQNLPVGVQLIGNYFKESQLLNVAHRFQMETDFHQQMPELNHF